MQQTKTSNRSLLRRRLSILIFLCTLTLWLLNTSMLASTPQGRPTLIAHRGVYHLYDKVAAVGRDTCTAQFIHAPKHEIFENTLASIQQALQLGADLVEVDVARTSDAHMVLFHDWTLDCRTDGTGPIRQHSLAQLKALDIGYGYTTDQGKSFALRGKGVGQMPSVAEALSAFPQTPLLFNFKSKDAAEADLLYRILKDSGRDSERIGDAFYGGPELGPVGRMRELLPNNWSFSTKDQAQSCTRDYLLFGWSNFVPSSCANSVLVVPINYRWAFWGWPNRLIERMQRVGGRVIVMGPFARGKSNEGLTEPAQFESIPASFNGYIWVEDIIAIAPALRASK
jgi:glycerophosphoryl diester phosphodiesterase